MKRVLFLALVVGLAVASRREGDAPADGTPPAPAFSAASCGAEPGAVEHVVPDTAEARAAASDWCRRLTDTMTTVKQPGAPLPTT